MKSKIWIFLIVAIGMMVATGCSLENSEHETNLDDTIGRLDRHTRNGLIDSTDVNYQKGEEIPKEAPDLGPNSWYTVDVVNGKEYLTINGDYKKNIVNTVLGCSTCRVSCKYGRDLGNNIHFVACDNGHSYYAVYCNGNWTVTVATLTYYTGHVYEPNMPSGC